MTPDEAAVDRVLAQIDHHEVIDLALALGNIDSPTGSEGPACEYVFDWLARNGFEPRRHGLVADRFSVSATLSGSGGGQSLIFNGHLDTTLRPDAIWSARDPLEPLYRGAWLEDEMIVGDGVVNDKGPVAAFLVATKAIRDAGISLKGDLTMSAVAGEIGREPVDEFQGPDYLSKDLGTRFMVTHGVVADYALVAEGTGFGIVWVEPGMAQFKVTVTTEQPRYYTPYLPRPTSLAGSPNAIVRATAVIAEFETWALEYQQRFTEVRKGGTIVPKASVNAIRAGYPFELTSAPQVCSFYVDAYLRPGSNPNDIRFELQALLAASSTPGTVELMVYRPGFEAVGVERLVESIHRCHVQYFGSEPDPVGPQVSSMWRDTNAFTELGIPAVSYAPRAAEHAKRKALRAQDLVDAANLYAMIALDVCDQDRLAWTPLGSHLNAGDRRAASANTDAARPTVD
jgi:acetylornithine deacetylase/succinyl-diaminopimelate desuccinylase-like protein